MGVKPKEGVGQAAEYWSSGSRKWQFTETHKANKDTSGKTDTKAKSK